MSNNQNHWKEFEVLIKNGLWHGEYDVGATSFFDFPFWSIKTVKCSEKWSPVVCMGDARRVFSWFDTIKKLNKNEIRIIIGCYSQNGIFKDFSKIFEIIVENNENVKAFLYGELSIPEVFWFHNSIGKEFIKWIEECRSFARDTKENIKDGKKMWIISLNPKIDASQRRLQCSFPLYSLVNSRIDGIRIITHTADFYWITLPIKIESTERERNKNSAKNDS